MFIYICKNPKSNSRSLSFFVSNSVSMGLLSPIQVGTPVPWILVPSLKGGGKHYIIFTTMANNICKFH